MKSTIKPDNDKSVIPDSTAQSCAEICPSATNTGEGTDGESFITKLLLAIIARYCLPIRERAYLCQALLSIVNSLRAGQANE